MGRKFLTLSSLCLCVSVAHLSGQSGAPSIDDILNLKRVGTPAISPDGRQVAYTIRETNWDENAYETEILDWRHGHRPLAAADQRAQVEPAARVGPRWRVARVRVGPRRQAADLSHLGGGRRGRAAHEQRGGRHRLRVVAVGRADRLHDDRSGHRGDEGPREAMGRPSPRGSGSALHAPPRAGSGGASGQGPHLGPDGRGRLQLVAGRRLHRLRPSPHERRGRQRHGRHLHRQRRQGRAAGRRWRRRVPTPTRCGRPTGSASRSSRRWPSRSPSTRTP